MKREDISVIIWLIAGCLLVFMMVIVGGITRLTDSGLSMVDWNLFSGAIPPINQAEWIETFNQYRTIGGTCFPTSTKMGNSLFKLF